MQAQTGKETLTEKVLLGGATALLAVLPFSLMIAPVPLAALVYRHGLTAGFYGALSAAAFAALLTLSPAIMAQVLLILALGIALGEGLRELRGAGSIIGLASLVTLVTTLLLFFLFERVTGESPFEMAARFWEEGLMAMLGSQAGGEVPAEVREAVLAQIEQIRRTIPASVLLGSVALVVVDFALVRWLLARLGSDLAGVAALPSFGAWRFPPLVAGAYVGAAALGRFFSGAVSGPFVSTLLLNANLVLASLLVVQGAAVGWHFLERWGVARPLRVALLAGMFLFAPGLVFLFLLTGIVDAGFHLRKRFSQQGGHVRESDSADECEETGKQRGPR